MKRRLFPIAAVLALAIASAALLAQAPSSAWLSVARVVAPGIEFYTTTDRTLVNPAGPIAAYLLKLDPKRVRLDSVLSNDEVFGAEIVPGIAARHHAIAAVNGGFFNTRNGEPVSLLKVAGELVSDNPQTKGIVLIRSPARGTTTMVFDQASANMSLTFKAGGREWRVPIDGVDTTRERGKLMLYTPAYHADTDTAANGTDWVMSGKSLRVTGLRKDQARTPIPRDGAVLSFGGLELPPALAALTTGTTVTLRTEWTSANGVSTKEFDQADHIVNGAGLLRRNGKVPVNWETAEKLNPANFLLMRHPRTVIGVDDKGSIWLIAIDGRQPDYSVGMSFAELGILCDRLKLRNALNLDGGGSTTMVVKDAIVNRPSDATGPRPVSDAILVSSR